MASAPRRVAIACQGGGSQTAFTAGVLGRLLQDGRFRRRQYEPVALSGTSGGAICALLAWYGLLGGDHTRVRELLESFWRANAARPGWDQLVNTALVWASQLQGVVSLPGVSPYFYPPYGQSWLRSLLEQHVVFARLPALITPDSPLLLVGAVDVESGQFKVFKSTEWEITVEALLASAALPTLFRAVRIGHGVYWDGLFSQNPPVRDLPDADNRPERAPQEIWVIRINPETAEAEPTTLPAILTRRDQLAGNLSLQQELYFIEYINKLVRQGLLTGGTKPYREIEVRTIALPRWLAARSKLDRSPDVIEELMREGAAEAERFLATLPVPA